MLFEGFSIELEWFFGSDKQRFVDVFFTISWVHSIKNRHTGNEPTADKDIFSEYAGVYLEKTL